MLAHLANALFNGVAYGMLLFLMAGGLSVTMGLMGFANLAHIAFAMLGGYIAVLLMNDAGWPFLATLPAAALGTAAVAALFERLIFRRLYRQSQLDQVLLTIGLVLMSVAAATYLWGPQQQPVRMPAYLTGQFKIGPLDFAVYRVFLIGVGALLTIGLVLGIDYTLFGARIRAAVDNRRMTSSCGINVDRLFTVAFAIGSALAGIGGALSVNLLGLDPSFPTKYLVYVLIVVVVSGMGSLKGTLLAAVALGACDVLGKYYVPQTGAFIIYALAVGILLVRPQGLFGRR